MSLLRLSFLKIQNSPDFQRGYRNSLQLLSDPFLQTSNMTQDDILSIITFTGGVDSTFTLWSHLPQNQPVPEFRITHAIFLKGFDILPTEEQKYWHLFDRFKPTAAKRKITIIMPYD